jgi:WD40 repeat protein
MQTRISIFIALVASAILTIHTQATTVGTSLMSQLTYLGEASERDRIPLSLVVCNSNYGYGSASAIFQSRPCYHGGMLDGGRIIYEQNLAVLFGISCKLSDSTQFQGCTATLTLKKAKPPSNAPYSQEQVLSAGLQLLLLNAHNISKEFPFTVVIKGDGIPTPTWAKKYAKDYYNEMGKDGRLKTGFRIQGIEIEKSFFGVRYVVFEGVAPDPKIKRREPAFILYRSDGESDGSDMFVPVWYGDTWENPLNVMFFPCLPYYEKWHGNRYDLPRETGALQYIPPANHIGHDEFEFIRADEGITVKFRGMDLTAKKMMDYIDTWILNLKPTAKCPLTISFPVDSIPEDMRLALLYDPAWKNQSSCEFVLDPKTGKLLKGSVPNCLGENGSYDLSIFKDGNSVVKPNTRYELKDRAGTLGYSPCGKYLAIATQTTLSMVEIATSKTIFKQAFPGTFTSYSKVLFSSDGKYVTLDRGNGYNGSTLTVFEVATGKVGFKNDYDDAIRAIKFSPDGKSIGVVFDDILRRPPERMRWKTLQIYDLATSKVVCQYGYKKSSTRFAFSHDSRSVAVHDESLCVMEVLTGKILFKQEKVSPDINMITFAPDEKHIVAAVGSRRVIVCNITTGKTVEHSPVTAAWHAINFSPDGNKIAIRTTKDKNKHTLTFYALNTSKIISQLDLPNRFRNMQFSPDWKYVGVLEYNGWLSVYEVAAAKKVFYNNNSGECFAFSPDGKFIATNQGNESIEIFKLISPKN